MRLKKALLIVDVQNDFCPGGALGVPQGDKVVPVLNRYVRLFAQQKLPIFASQDWHPVRTSHFSSFGGIWPVHCIQGTKGAQLHPDLKLPKESIILYKGMDPQKESYSAFQSEDRQGMSFYNLLKIMGITDLFIGGLATDYCVKSSALDALRHGFKVKLMMDAIKGVNLKPRDAEEAIEAVLKAGGKKFTADKFVLKPLAKTAGRRVRKIRPKNKPRSVLRKKKLITLKKPKKTKKKKGKK